MPLSPETVIGKIRSLPRTARSDRRLAAMLSQSAGHYAGLSTGDAERVRGHVLAAFGDGRSPVAALPAIREELRTSLSPIVLAGAARALRGLQAIDEEVRALLLAASERIALRDEYVRFDGAPGDSPPLTARDEIAAALKAAASAPPRCCGGRAATGAETAGSVRLLLPPAALERAAVEDQSGERIGLAALLRRRPSLVAFFYTRCMNPAKCSLTVTRLAGLARDRAAAGQHDLNLIGFSYDGAYDSPARLRAYGRDRGFPFGESARLIRCRAGWNAARDAFRLQVGYGQATVNDHARELFLVRPDLLAIGLDAESLADHDAIERAVASLQAARL